MALEIRDRVKETCTGTSGDMTLTGAVLGFVGFDLDATLDGDTIYYALEDADGTKWEVGLGTLSADSTSIARTTILATQVSFTDTTRQTFSGGTHTIFGTYPASKAVFLDASGNLSHTVDISTDTNLVAGTGITLTGDTLSTTDGDIVHDNLSGFVANEHIDWTSASAGTIHASNYVDNDTTYTAGDGLDLTSTTFSLDLKLNGGLVIETTELAVDLGASSITGTLAAGDGGTGLTSISTLLNSNTTSTDVGLGNVENTALSTWAGTTNITTLGTIVTGVWNGTAIANANLANSSLTIGTTSISLGATSTTLAGITTLGVDVLDMSVLVTASQPAHAEGLLFYDDDNKTLTLYNDEADVSLQIGQEQYIRVRNNSGATITDGTPVRINSSQGTHPTIVEAQANTEANSMVAGLATHDIENNSFGYVTTLGTVRGLDTSAYSDGDELFLSATAGELTGTAPVAPNFETSIGFVVRSHASNGAILVFHSPHALGGGDVKSSGAISVGCIPFFDAVADTTAGTVDCDANFTYDSGTSKVLFASGGFQLDSVSISTLQTSAEAFADNDTSLMTSAAIEDKILSYSYSTTTGTVTSVAISGTDGIDVDSGSPITGAGTITLGLSNIANDKLANSSITVSDGSNTTAVSLGGTMTFSGTSNEVEVGESSGTVTIGLPNDVTIAGNLTVNGDTVTINTATLSVEDPLIILASGNNAADSVDIGFYGLYDTSGSQDLYAGLFRDANDSGKFKLFKDLQAAPTTTVNVLGTGYAVATLVADIEGNVTGNADTVTTNANLTGHVTSTGNAAVLGSFTVAQLSTALSDASISGNNNGDVTLAGTPDYITISNQVITRNAIDLANDVTGTLPVGSVGTITLGTNTAGNYVATITGGTGITSTGATTGEGIAHSLSVDASQTQITAIGTITTGEWQGTAIANDYVANLPTSKVTSGTFADARIASSNVTQHQGDITSLGTLVGLTLDGDKNITPGDGSMIHLDTSTLTDNSTSGSATTAKFANVAFEGPTLAATNSSVTTTDAATVYISAAPTAGTNQTLTNAWSLWVDAGNVRLDGSLKLDSVLLSAVQTSAEAFADNDTSIMTSAAIADKVEAYGYITATLTQEQVEDYAGALVATGGTKTGIAVTYQDGTGDMDFVVSDLTVAGDTGSTGMTPGDTLTIAGGTNVTTAMSGDTLTVTATDTNTTYTAGDGLDLTSTTFSADLKANGGLVIETTELAVDLGASSITGTLAVADGGTGATSLNNLITLATHTTGDFVSTITAGTGLTSTGATSGENIAHSLSVDASQTQITAVGTLTSLVIADGGNIGSASDTDAMAISSTGTVTFSQATKPALKSNTDGATVTFDLNVANVHRVTLGGNRTLAISNETDGQTFVLRLLQDATGSRTVTWFSTIKWAGGTAPTLTTTASKADVFGFVCTGTDTYDGFIIGQNV